MEGRPLRSRSGTAHRRFVLLMSEGGELVLLRPTPTGPGELHRFRVFSEKTWNPIALAGDLLIVRNDQEAVALRVKLASGSVVGGRSE